MLTCIFPPRVWEKNPTTLLIVSEVWLGLENWKLIPVWWKCWLSEVRKKSLLPQSSVTLSSCRDKTTRCWLTHPHRKSNGYGHTHGHTTCHVCCYIYSICAHLTKQTQPDTFKLRAGSFRPKTQSLLHHTPLNSATFNYQESGHVALCSSAPAEICQD